MHVFLVSCKVLYILDLYISDAPKHAISFRENTVYIMQK